jgi:phosphate transport system substrate-binding protein
MNLFGHYGPRALLLAAAALAALSSAAIATPGDTLIYRGGAQGKVVFDGRMHAAQGLQCSACHSALFPTQRVGRITMADHGTDKACFACHNGKRAFDTCASCHRQVPNT